MKCPFERLNWTFAALTIWYFFLLSQQPEFIKKNPHLHALSRLILAPFLLFSKLRDSSSPLFPYKCYNNLVYINQKPPKNLTGLWSPLCGEMRMVAFWECWDAGSIPSLVLPQLWLRLWLVLISDPWSGTQFVAGWPKKKYSYWVW